MLLLLLTKPSDLNNEIHEIVRPHHLQHEIRSLKQVIMLQGNTVKRMLRSGLNHVALCADIELLITTRESEGFLSVRMISEPKLFGLS
ncbi:hypothetical protein AVEN_2299-1 [Araneus ventricosus]|uniref:Uncharacterized protein n=1 Tax=Araneus ventricosus TaxID=182803 RepID=A0A4Y2AL41_ARAVE|nr:hypothetical protein AVEN_2299-1 [Araneus ventricosus]